MFPAIPLRLAYRPAPRTFQLALRCYSVASLPRASRFALASCSLRSRVFRAHENFRKKSVSQSTLKRVKMQKKKLPLLTHYALRA